MMVELYHIAHAHIRRLYEKNLYYYSIFISLDVSHNLFFSSLLPVFYVDFVWGWLMSVTNILIKYHNIIYTQSRTILF